MRRSLEGGVALLLGGPALAQDEASYASSDVHRPHPLEFRIDSSYRPDLSDAAGARLAAVTLEFVRSEHPGGATVLFWGLPPARMPFLTKHLENVVERVFRGVRDSLGIRPVDPIAMLSILYNESRFHPKIVSPAGAMGMAQFMPITAVQFDLDPVFGIEEFRSYQQARGDHRRRRRSELRAFRSRHSIGSAGEEGVMRRAVERKDLGIVDEYLSIVDREDPSEAMLTGYIDRLEAALAQHEFFWDGQDPLAAIDARASYRAVERSVRYVAQQLDDYQGMMSTAVAAYNAGPDAVRVRSRRSLLYRFGEIPNYAETIRYVQRFLAAYAAIKHILHESTGS